MLIHQPTPLISYIREMATFYKNLVALLLVLLTCTRAFLVNHMLGPNIVDEQDSWEHSHFIKHEVLYNAKNGLVDIVFELRSEIDNVDASLYFSLNSCKGCTHFMAINTTIDICALFKDPPMTQIVDLMRENESTDTGSGCPIPAGRYEFRNLKAIDVNLLNMVRVSEYAIQFKLYAENYLILDDHIKGHFEF